jgi:hypothetical protein
MNQDLYAHMNNKRKMKKKILNEKFRDHKKKKEGHSHQENLTL